MVRLFRKSSIVSVAPCVTMRSTTKDPSLHRVNIQGRWGGERVTDPLRLLYGARQGDQCWRELLHAHATAFDGRPVVGDCELSLGDPSDSVMRSTIGGNHRDLWDGATVTETLSLSIICLSGLGADGDSRRVRGARRGHPVRDDRDGAFRANAKPRARTAMPLRSTTGKGDGVGTLTRSFMG